MAQAYRTFGSYLLFEEIIADTLGHLYRAGEFDADGLKRIVWLRVLDGPHVPTSDILGQFQTATKIGEVLHATNVVSDPTYLEHGGVPAIAWEYAAAQPLSRVLHKVHEEGFPVPVDNALLIMEKLSLALSAGLAVELRGSSLTHGFMHPGLVTVTTDGEALISGFGIADQLLGALDDPVTADACTPYLAPEVVASRSSGKRGDVYSLGAILYQLLTGDPLPPRPEEREGILDRAELAYEEEPVPDDIKSLLERALAARPEDRFSSAADFKKELDKLLYGGAYSPTTFNLALFMDRLFRAEIEEEEKARAEESAIDVTPYLQPEPEPEEIAPEPAPSAGGGKGLWIGIAAAAVLVAVVAVVFVSRGPKTPPVAPTPSPEQLAAERAAQQEHMRQLAAQMVEEMMAEKEDEIRQELRGRQKRIDELQRELSASKQRASGGQTSSREQQVQQELQRKIAAEEEARRNREMELEAERQRAEEAARQQLAAQQAAATATAAAEEAEAEGPTQSPAEPTHPPAEPTRLAEGATPAEVPAVAASETAAGPAAATTRVETSSVVENTFHDPTDVDALPTVIKDVAVVWPRLALHSRRQGVVIVQATINADGKVDDVKILRADHDGFGIPQAVMEAVRKYQFRPATKDGVKVKTYATVTKRYKFRDR